MIAWGVLFVSATVALAMLAVLIECGIRVLAEGRHRLTLGRSARLAGLALAAAFAAAMISGSLVNGELFDPRAVLEAWVSSLAFAFLPPLGPLQAVFVGALVIAVRRLLGMPGWASRPDVAR